MDAIYTKERNRLEKLNARHYKILDLRMAGWKIQQIAGHLGMTRQQVSLVVNSPTFEHEFALQRARKEEIRDTEDVRGEDEVKTVLVEGAKKAAEKLVSTIGSDQEKNAIRSAAEILDRTGYAKTQRVEGGESQQIVVIGSDELSRLTKALEMDNRT